MQRESATRKGRAPAVRASSVRFASPGGGAGGCAVPEPPSEKCTSRNNGYNDHKMDTMRYNIVTLR